jgi:Uma2 family endonuclease
MSANPSNADSWTFAQFVAVHAPSVLSNGDRMSRAEFHARYEKTDERFKAELIEGEVFVASLVSWRHGRLDAIAAGILGHYEAHTPCVEGASNTTVLLSDDNEVQPDVLLRIITECGGHTRVERQGEGVFLAGPPELVIEIAFSSRSIDLHRKRRAYQAHGVLEYVVVCVEEQKLRWFDLPADLALSADSDGVLRLKQFSGLWINAAAVCQLDAATAMKTLEAGLASPEHAAFVERLRVAHAKSGGSEQPAG